MACHPKPGTQSSSAKATKDGGAEGIRTPDPHNAIVVLYQLSYDPIQFCECKFLRPFVKTIHPMSNSVIVSVRT